MINRRSLLLSGAATAFMAATPAGATERRMPMVEPHITLGDDVFIRETWRELRGRGVGIVTNQSGVLSDGRAFADAAAANSAIAIKALFGPEHGIRGAAAAGVHVDSSTDERTGLPVYSLYGANRRPSEAMLAGIDVMLFDIQDVGARPYTYVSTMAYVMEACAKSGREMWVLDRPNPIGGIAIDGPVLDPRFKSFTGLYPIPERHGLTVGELARMINERFGVGATLRVIPMRGWTRDMLWADTGLHWVPTSPNIPYGTTPLVYLATGLIDQGGVNNAVGTDRPFEYAGGYGFDGPRLADALNARQIPGVRFTPATWSPVRGFWAGKTLAGVHLDILDARAFPNVRSALEILAAARAQNKFKVASAATMDRDWGTDTVRIALESGVPADHILASWQPGLRAFDAARAAYLLYR